MTIVTLLLILGATARITRIINTDVIFEPFRNWVYMRSQPGHGSDDYHTYEHFRKRRKNDVESKSIILSGKSYTWDMNLYREPGFFGNLISCQDCLSVWMGAFTVVLYVLFPVYSLYFFSALTASLFTAILARII